MNDEETLPDNYRIERGLDTVPESRKVVIEAPSKEEALEMYEEVWNDG